MIIGNLDRILKTPTGVEIDGFKNSGKLRLRDAIIHALLAPLEDDGKLPGTKKFEIGQIAQKVHEAELSVELPVEQVSMIKDRVSKVFFVSVVFAVFNALESKGE